MTSYPPEIGKPVRASVWGGVGASVWDSVADSVGNSVRDKVEVELEYR